MMRMITPDYENVKIATAAVPNLTIVKIATAAVPNLTIVEIATAAVPNSTIVDIAAAAATNSTIDRESRDCHGCRGKLGSRAYFAVVGASGPTSCLGSFSDFSLD